MIGRLTGKLVEEAPGGDLLIDVGGVGYEVTAPLGTRGRAGEDPAGLTTLYVHTHVREDALQLFAFSSGEEREAFRTIIGISNVGPKLGIAILGAVTVYDLAQIVARGEVAKLTTIPGVGKKTAERLVLELKGKLSATQPARSSRNGEAGPATTPGPAASTAEVLTATLTRMGFRPAEADRAVATLAQNRGFEAPMSELVREALAILSR